MYRYLSISALILMMACNSSSHSNNVMEAFRNTEEQPDVKSFIMHETAVAAFDTERLVMVDTTEIFQLMVLGNVQDAGSPHVGCSKSCCAHLFKNPDPSRMVVSLGLIDLENGKNYLIEATPDMPSQVELLNRVTLQPSDKMPDGVFVSHAHIGHYTGLMYFGREAKGAQNVSVFAMPGMAGFLANNGPWSQLVALNNIRLHELSPGIAQMLADQLSVKPILVPHRDEFSETVGFIISGPKAKLLFIPDIDKWDKWGESITTYIAQVDYALLDATFYDGSEIPNRDMSEIPHPFVVESLALFDQLPMTERNKIYFIHLNHTNPLLNQESEQSKFVESKGFHIARLGQIFGL